MDGKRHESRLRVVIGAIALSCLLSCAAAAGTANLVGKPAPPLAGVDLHQQPVDLAALRGRRVLLMFWATWCSPCRKEMPLVQAAFVKYQAHGFAVIAVNVGDDTEDADKFLKQFDLEFPVILDKKGNTAQRFQVVGLPTNYFIDSAGAVRAEILGDEHTAERLENFLQPSVTAQ